MMAEEGKEGGSASQGSAGPAGRKTQYRAVGGGSWDWLEYAVPRRFLWFRWTEWRPVPKAYSRWPYPRGYFDICGRNADECVNSCDERLDRFVEKWPCIADYLIQFAREQAAFDARWEAKEKEYRSNKGRIKPLGIRKE